MNNDEYFNQTLAETIELIVSCNAYQAMYFVSPIEFNRVITALIESIASTTYTTFINVNGITITKIRFFSTFYVSLYGDTYRVEFINSKKIKVILE